MILGTRLRDRFRAPLSVLGKWFERWDWLAYLSVAGGCTLLVACIFYSSLRLQTLYVWLWNDPAAFDRVAQHGLWGEWSAPLDDVFIHFDFARATARGHPFEWIAGNGYSSGGTSLLYPFVLALGYWLGFQGMHLMVWAGMVACVSVLALLIAAQRLFDGLPSWTRYLAPPLLLSTGVLDWTLFSGMEVALFLGVWGGTWVAWDELRNCDGTQRLTGLSVALGVACLLLVGTRPEAAITVAIFSVSAAVSVCKRFGRRHAVVTLLWSASPAAALVVAQAIANRVLTGDFTAAGALAKLEMHHPYLTAKQVWEAWLFHVSYQVRRISEYHLSSVPWLGYLLWVFAALAVAFRRTRTQALLLWACATAWVLVVALNGQVRWQNERYTMPALAWLLLAAALGFAELLTRRFTTSRRRVVAQGASVVALATFAFLQAPRFRDQVWFFGRASRNILDQHVRAGRLLRERVRPTPKRILLSDAGAIPYAADLPAVDLIGLGGFRHLPFARATRLGAPAGLELIERLTPAERPDVFALYPSWWHTFPLWFGRRLDEVPVRGNVICGGVSKVLYSADWTAMDGSSKPFRLPNGERLVDALDVADVISEGEHRFTLSETAAGHTTMKLLADPNRPERGLWDAGRLFSPPLQASFVLHGLDSSRPVELRFRVAPSQEARFAIESNGERLGSVALEPADVWQEVPLRLAADKLAASFELTLVPLEGGFALYHVWASQPR